VTKVVNLTELSEAQRQVYDSLVQGRTPEQAATALGTTLGVVNAQMTRIRNKGISLPGDPNYRPSTETIRPEVPSTHIDPAQVLTPPPGGQAPAKAGPTSNEQVAAALQGQALSADQLAQLAARVGGSAARDIHPMILLGVTIQYVKLCGGRLTAHQVIEDVYSALRGFTTGSSTPAPGEDGGTQPLPQSDKERLVFLDEQNQALMERVRSLEARLRSQNPTPSQS
jgi:hypothetical protein